MSDIYVECLVQKKRAFGGRLLVGSLITLAVLSFLLMMIVNLVFLVFLAALLGAYIAHIYTNIEYEYLYFDRELVIDKVLAKTKRKRIGTYSVDRMEVMAPIRSYHLDAFKHREGKVKDYSIGEELQPDQRYVIYYEGGEKLILSPSEELVKAMKNISPRKIFMD